MAGKGKEKVVAPAAAEVAYLYADLVKREKLADGSIIVVGEAADAGHVDRERQIADPKWLAQALPEWFRSYANIREMHGLSAVGKGQQLDMDAPRPVLTSKIVDPLAVKKVEEGIYSAYSIGVKDPRIEFDGEAAKGRIVGGRIIEVSLVDYPGQNVQKFAIVKAAKPDVIGDESVEADAKVAQAPSDAEWAQLEKAATTDAAAELAKAITADALRAQVLNVNPSVSKAELDALVSTFEAIQTPSGRAGGQPGLETAKANQEDGETDSDATDSKETAAGSAKSQAKPDATAPTGGASTMDVAGTLKTMLPDELKAVLPDVLKVALAAEETKSILADVLKTVAADLVKSTVEGAVKPLRESVEKLEKVAAPGGAFVGGQKAFAANLQIEASSRAAASAAQIEYDSQREFLAGKAALPDPVQREAARGALRILDAEAQAGGLDVPTVAATT